MAEAWYKKYFCLEQVLHFIKNKCRPNELILLIVASSYASIFCILA